MNVIEAIATARTGKRLTLSTKKFSGPELTAIAQALAAAPGSSKLEIQEAGRLNALAMAGINYAGRGKVVFN